MRIKEEGAYPFLHFLFPLAVRGGKDRRRKREDFPRKGKIFLLLNVRVRERRKPRSKAIARKRVSPLFPLFRGSFTASHLTHLLDLYSPPYGRRK